MNGNLPIEEYFRYHPPVTQERIKKHDTVNQIALEFAKIVDAIEAQESEEIGDEIVARFNPESGAIENLEILFFSKRLNSSMPLKLPVFAALTFAD